GIKVHVLYPKGKVSAIQECQFTTLGRNITALEVDGTFDDCQALVKKAFLDEELNSKFLLTSANSINVARFLPQAFYYFNAYAQLKRLGKENEMVVTVPSGNFGNLSAALIAKRMGLPVKRFIAACNSNRPFPDYIESGVYSPRPSVATIANAMDVGAPSNFARILDLYAGSHDAIAAEISSVSYSDADIAETMKQCYRDTGYLLDPHGAVAFKATGASLERGETGVFLETAHPAKFKSTVDEILGTDIALPERLAAFTKGTKQSVAMTTSFADFAAYLNTAAR
ncbi:MAG: threonine synthase, partial [Muribaculaceae bacterium]|nr:threonine synthase [Muribaculaceae bacterium]